MQHVGNAKEVAQKKSLVSHLYSQKTDECASRAATRDGSSVDKAQLMLEPESLSLNHKGEKKKIYSAYTVCILTLHPQSLSSYSMLIINGLDGEAPKKKKK